MQRPAPGVHARPPPQDSFPIAQVVHAPFAHVMPWHETAVP